MQIITLSPSDTQSLEFWREQWFALFREQENADLSCSYQWLANDFLSLGKNHKRRCYIAHQDGQFKGAIVCQPSWYKLGRYLPVPVINTGSHFTNDFPVDNAMEVDALDALVDAIHADFPYAAWINFDRLTSGCYRQLESWTREKRVTVVSKNNDQSAVFDVGSGDYATFIQRLTLKTRKNLRYYRGLLERKVGEVKHVVVSSQSVEEMSSNFKEFLVIEESGWKGEKGTAIGQLAHSEEFHYALCETAATEGQMHWDKLYAGGKLVAMSMVIHKASNLWVVKTAFSHEFNACSPGTIGLTELLKSAIEDKTITSVRMITNYSWLDRWVPNVETYRGARIFGKNLPGKLASFVFTLLQRDWTRINVGNKS
ncbi:MAG: hypothetical protein ACI92E_002179 [Oceanicoccus sp.]|jgi:hypothetical protein